MVRTRTFKPTSIGLTPEIIELTDRIAVVEERTRSQVIRMAIKEYAALRGMSTSDAWVKQEERETHG